MQTSTQIDFGTDKKSRNRAYIFAVKSGVSARRFTLTGQILHGRYIGTVYFLEVGTEKEGVLAEINSLASKAQESIRFPSDFDKHVNGVTETTEA